jgi:hypothetical protein
MYTTRRESVSTRSAYRSERHDSSMWRPWLWRAIPTTLLKHKGRTGIAAITSERKGSVPFEMSDRR